ncbi:MAG: lytic murein transglycosylase, partial [Solirubrobacterales bacterium]
MPARRRRRRRRRAWPALLSALAAGVITAVGLGPLSGGALGDAPASSPTSTEGSSTPVTTSSAGAGIQDGGTGQPSTTTTTIPVPSSTSTGPQAGIPAPAVSEAPTVVLQRRQKTTAGRNVSRRVSARHAQPTTGGANASKGRAPSGSNNVAPAPQLVAAQAGALAAELAGSAASVQALSYYRIPLFLLPIYQAAAVQYGVPWQILAAINEVETNYGSDQSVSTAGAVGWMQFMPATWAEYGVDALNAGYADPYNPVDAIFAAARYLKAAGASSNLRAAILAYNHSAEYVSSVLLRARLISKYPTAVIATLTGLTDGRLPVAGKQVAWGSLAAVPSSSGATVHAAAVPSGASAKLSAPPATSRSAAPSPATAAAATGTVGAAGQARQLVDVTSAPNAAVVAVQDGRVLKLGVSRKLGRYVILRDIYGDVFTYAGLGSIVSSYRLPKAPRTARAFGKPPVAPGAKSHEPAPPQPASAGRELPLTLQVNTSARKTSAGAAGRGRGADGGARSQVSAPAGSSESVPPAATGKVRLFAHPGNPDALASAASAPGDAKRSNPR